MLLTLTLLLSSYVQESVERSHIWDVQGNQMHVERTKGRWQTTEVSHLPYP